MVLTGTCPLASVERTSKEASSREIWDEVLVTPLSRKALTLGNPGLMYCGCERTLQFLYTLT